MNKKTLKMIINIIITFGFLALLEPKLTGMSLHEWGGLAIGLLFLVHMTLNIKWIAAITKRFFRKLPAKQRINYILDFVLLTGFTFIILSGMAMAKTIDFSWLSLGRTLPWKAIHVSGSMMVIMATGLHLGLHWGWVVRRFKAKKRSVAC